MVCEIRIPFYLGAEKVSSLVYPMGSFLTLMACPEIAPGWRLRPVENIAKVFPHKLSTDWLLVIDTV